MCRNYDAGECEEEGCSGRITCHDFHKRCAEHDINGRGMNRFLQYDDEDEDQPRGCSVGSLTLRREGRNARGMRVLAARCVCGWVHMTAYPLFRKRSRARYLRRRFTDHLYASWVAS